MNFNIELGPPAEDKNTNKNTNKKTERDTKHDLKMALSELRDLPMFGSIEWYAGGFGALTGAKGIFSIGNNDSKNKNEVILMAVVEGEALIAETVGLGHEVLMVSIRPVQIINDELDDKWWQEAKVFYHCRCGRREVKILSAAHLSKIIEHELQTVCVKCATLIRVELIEGEKEEE